MSTAVSNGDEQGTVGTGGGLGEATKVRDVEAGVMIAAAGVGFGLRTIG